MRNAQSRTIILACLAHGLRTAENGTRGQARVHCGSKGEADRQPLLIAPSFLLSPRLRKRRHICGPEYASFRCMVTGGLGWLGAGGSTG
jgi:hypothetical protein